MSFLLWLLALLCVVLFGLWLYIRPPTLPLPNKKALKVCFVHPDLGIGGAEKLVVDAAVGVQSKGHHVEIFTSFHDPNPRRSFPETNDGTLRVSVHGNWLPYHAVGRFQLVKALLRFLWLSIVVLRRHKQNPFDIMFVDQISATLPLLKLGGAKIIFYCHFPDQLLTQRKSIIKWLYRLPLDYLEEFTTGVAHEILVNSEYTSEVFEKTFTHLNRKPQVLYPAIDINVQNISEKDFSDGKPIKFLSLNRYERKKNISLALEAFAILKNTEKYKKGLLRLVIAGGYSTLVQENVEHLLELQQKAKELGIQDNVEFLCSISLEEKNLLLQEAICLLYTPPNEHFGIVPLEAGILCTPVIACNSGGPRETIENGKTGFLREPTPNSWAAAMTQIINDPKKASQMGKMGKKRVEILFSRKQFINRLVSVFHKYLNIQLTSVDWFFIK